ncbi:hypothetical protein [Agaribacterium haliotis]|uniref:hypothetical protein n=1 Tax=Agaribacterium haliotis TaxID=2013869 RepID=UPI000BB58B68|nr:hypothetical protein [Agaribacterium haliotis]
MAVTDTSQNHILEAAGLHTTASRRSFKKQYPDAGKLYSDTYNALDDQKLKQKFTSNNKEESAAAIIASKRMAEKNRSFVNASETSGKHQQKIIANATFEEEYKAALKEIKQNQIDTSDPVALAAFSKNDLKQSKSQTAQPKTASHSVVSKCKKELKCELSTFSINLENVSDEAPFTIVDNFFEKRSGKTQEHLTEETPIDDRPAPSLDLFKDDCPSEYHIITGKLKYFRAQAMIKASGSCDHGQENICPTVKVICQEAKFSGGKNELEVGHGDKALKQLNLIPKTLGSVDDWATFLRLLKKQEDAITPANYHFSVRSHQKNAPYTGYQTLVKAYPFTLMAFTTSLTFGKNPEAKISALARLDDHDKTISFSTTPKEALNDLTGTSWLYKTLRTLHLISKGFSALGGSDDGEIIDVDNAIDTDTEEHLKNQESDSVDARNLPVQIHLSYRRILKALPDNSGVGFKQEFFIAGSPLLKYQKDIDLIRLLCKTSLSAASLGASDLINYLGVSELIEASFNNAKIFFKQVAKDIKQEEVADEEVAETLEGDNGGSTSVKCILSCSLAIETDNPGAGLVFKKEPGQNLQWDKKSTSIYGGGNFQVSGEVSSDLKIFKSIGFGSLVDKIGANLNIQSADSTGEVRLAFNLTADPGEANRIYDNEKKEGRTDIEKADDELENASGQVPVGSPAGCSLSLLFSGIGIYIEAYITTAEDQSETDVADTEQARQPGRRRQAVNEADTSNQASKQVKKRISFQVMKARESKAKSWQLPFDKFTNS